MVAPFVPPEAQTSSVVVVNVTASPDDAVAPTVTGDCCAVWAAIGPKVMVCGATVTLKLRVSAGAALKVSLPAWSACTVHTPVPTSRIEAPFVPLGYTRGEWSC